LNEKLLYEVLEVLKYYTKHKSTLMILLWCFGVIFAVSASSKRVTSTLFKIFPAMFHWRKSHTFAIIWK